MSLVYRDVREGCSTGVRIRNGDAPEGAAPDDMWTHVVRHVGIPESVVGVGVTVGPAISRDREDIARGIKAALGQCPTYVGADIALNCLKWHCQHLSAPYAILFAPRQARTVGVSLQMDNDGLRGIIGTFVPAHRHWYIKPHI